jgi:hypothetical protein
MPMKPKDGENKDDFISRCTSEMSKSHPDWENDKCVAACFSMYRAGLWSNIRKSIKRLIGLL